MKKCATLEANGKESTVGLGKVWAKKSCKKCFGRGYHTIQHNNGNPIKSFAVDDAVLCSCAQNKLNKVDGQKGVKHHEQQVESAVSRLGRKRRGLV